MRPHATLTLSPCWHLTATCPESGERITLGRYRIYEAAEAARIANAAREPRLQSEHAWHGSDGRWYAVQMRQIAVEE